MTTWRSNLYRLDRTQKQLLATGSHSSYVIHTNEKRTNCLQTGCTKWQNVKTLQTSYILTLNGLQFEHDHDKLSPVLPMLPLYWQDSLVWKPAILRIVTVTYTVPGKHLASTLELTPERFIVFYSHLSETGNVSCDIRCNYDSIWRTGKYAPVLKKKAQRHEVWRERKCNSTYMTFTY
jgi:hypothetical protein